MVRGMHTYSVLFIIVPTGTVDVVGAKLVHFSKRLLIQGQACVFVYPFYMIVLVCSFTRYKKETMSLWLVELGIHFLPQDISLDHVRSA